MMKDKLFLIVLVFTFSIVLTGNSSLASINAPFDAVYMVGSEFSTIEKDIFDLNDPAPWLYVKTPETHPFDLTLALFSSPSSNVYWAAEFFSPSQEIWVSLDDAVSGITPKNWNDIAEVGIWNVSAIYSGISLGPVPQFDSYVGSTSFTVTPEPLSSLLFITGAAVFGGRLYWKKRKPVTSL